MVYFKNNIRLKGEEGMTISYRPKGVCSQLMEIEIDDGKVKSLEVMGGCSGNLQGIAKLIEGMDVEEVIRRTEGIRCGRKRSSCPDQLAKALRLYLEGE